MSGDGYYLRVDSLPLLKTRRTRKKSRKILWKSAIFLLKPSNAGTCKTLEQKGGDSRQAWRLASIQNPVSVSGRKGLTPQARSLVRNAGYLRDMDENDVEEVIDEVHGDGREERTGALIGVRQEYRQQEYRYERRHRAMD